MEDFKFWKSEWLIIGLMTIISISVIFMMLEPYQFTLSFLTIFLIVVILTWKLYQSEDIMEKTYNELNILTGTNKYGIYKSPNYEMVILHLKSYLSEYLNDEQDRKVLLLNQELMQIIVENKKLINSTNEIKDLKIKIENLKDISVDENFEKELYILLFYKYAEWLNENDELFDEKFKKFIDSSKNNPGSITNKIEK